MTDVSEHLYIDTVEALDTLCSQLLKKPYIIIDTEFLRERTYRPELCLVQIKHEDILACIDTIAISNLSSLSELLLDPGITKVFHAASQDLEIFYLLCKQVPAPLFDTQVAAPLLGYNEQIGYANLVKEHLGIELSKSHTRADWTRRPLPAQQIQYALDDVIYLESLYLDMNDQLNKLGRLAWLQPEFDAQTDPHRYDQPAAERWKKIKNVQRYKGATLSVIQQLAKWREIKARETNQPRNWLIKDEVILSIAQQRPDSTKELGHIRSLERKTRDRFSAELVEIVASAMELTPEPHPPFKRKQKLSAQKLAQLQLLAAWTHQKSAELGIAPTLLAPQKLLENMVTGDGREAVQGWRDPLIGDDLEALLEGKAQLCIEQHALTMTLKS